MLSSLRCTRLFDLECQFFRSVGWNARNENLSFVESIAEFISNFESRCKASLWMHAIDFNSFHISGGCIVDSLCKHPPESVAVANVDINFNGDLFCKFQSAVNHAYADLVKIPPKDGVLSNMTLMKKRDGSYIIALLPNIQLKFNFKNVPGNTDSVSYVLHSSDIDASQIAFTGEKNQSQLTIIFYAFNRFAFSLYSPFPASTGDKVIYLLLIACNDV